MRKVPVGIPILSAVVLILCLICSASVAYAELIERPNQRGTLYPPPWNNAVVKLATSCKGLLKPECTMLRRLIDTPHAYWMSGVNPILDEDIRELHAILIDADSEKQVPTIVVYSLPNRDCGGSARLGGKFTAEKYKEWINKVADAVNYHTVPINIILEPHGLAEVVSNPYSLCDLRKKSEVLAERIELIQYAAWGFAAQDSEKKRVNPKVRLFVDVGNPGIIKSAKEKIDMSNALELILKAAEVDGISVNVGTHYSFDESLTFAKELIELVRLDTRRRLTVAIDIGRSGNNKVEGVCNAKGVALDTLPATLAHPDPRVELVVMIKVPGESDGDGPGCNGGGPVGEFDMPLFLNYLRDTMAKHTPAK